MTIIGRTVRHTYKRSVHYTFYQSFCNAHSLVKKKYFKFLWIPCLLVTRRRREYSAANGLDCSNSISHKLKRMICYVLRREATTHKMTLSVCMSACLSVNPSDMTAPVVSRKTCDVILCIFITEYSKHLFSDRITYSANISFSLI